MPSQASSSQTLTKSSARLKRRKALSSMFALMCASVTFLALLMLVWLLWSIWRDGSKALNWNFVTAMPSYRPERAGVLPALVGSLWLLGITLVFAVPVGVGAAVFLQEYSSSNAFTRFVQVNIANLAAVPSVVYGILCLALLVRMLKLGSSLLAGGLTLGLLVLPVIIISAQEALRAVPSSLRDGSYALGATRWQTISRNVLPVATPGILTGVILSLSRAIGEAAPLLIIGGLAYVAFLPEGPGDQFTALPIQIFNWASQPKAAFKELSASAIIILLGLLLSMNAMAILLRYKFNKKL
ncbi:MAG: phosphate transport system permease protein [Abditibacteriota bacterium]|nr:phosphate transport system permease protein [Abditibacteriota bacterium]